MNDAIIISEAPSKLFRAVLDSAGVYFGMEEVADFAPGDIEVPEECDLPNGQYAWNAAQGCFVPLDEALHTTAPNAPLADRALYELIMATATPPAYCLEWCAWYEKTFDWSAK